jgi:hypothetical protein
MWLLPDEGHAAPHKSHIMAHPLTAPVAAPPRDQLLKAPACTRSSAG